MAQSDYRGQLNIRVIGPKQLEQWKKAAKVDGYSTLTEWVRRTLDREARKVAKR